VSPDSRLTQTLTTLLAEGPTKTGPDFGKASPVGLLIVVLLLFSVFALVWSMNRHLKKIPESFDSPVDDQLADPAETRSAADAPAGESDDGKTGEPPRESGG
jgi:hypothetical protein